MFNLTLIIVTAVITALVFYKGRGLLFRAITSFYPASVIYSALPNKAKFLFFTANAEQIFYSHAIIFGFFFIICFLIANSIVHGDRHRMGITKFIDALLLSASAVILTVALCFHILPSRDIFDLSKEVQNFLTSSMGYFVSVSVPMIVVYWMTRNRF